MWSAPTLVIWLGIVHYSDKGVRGLLVVATIQQPKKSGTTTQRKNNNFKEVFTILKI